MVTVVRLEVRCTERTLNETRKPPAPQMPSKIHRKFLLDDKREQCDVSGTLEGVGQHALVLHRCTGTLATFDLASAIEVALE